jgi:thiosulfate/3-mercaptopyruvate sulfurtransferase
LKHIKTMGWLAEHQNDTDLVIVDCRFVMGQPDAGRQAYEEAHIPGAIYMDLEKDLSGPVREHGGRHPLPDLGIFSLKIGGYGISNTTTVVAYDDQGGAMASRLWWMLSFLGHKQVYVLEAGFTAWKANGYPVDSGVVVKEPGHFSPRVNTAKMISVHELQRRLGEDGLVLIDSRESVRYLGLQEPIDKKAGHIPGAINHFWKDSLNEAGTWKSADEQAERFNGIDRDSELVVYCGSGVTACPNVLALQEAGFDKVRLYLGSWSDWISYEGNAVVVGEEE